MQPDDNDSTKDTIVSDQKRQIDDKLTTNLEMDLEVARQRMPEYRLKHIVTTEVRFA
jgi:hypothetical protein